MITTAETVNTKPTLFKTYFLVGIMLTLWASAYVGIRIGLKGYSPGSLALLRYLVASFCLLIIYCKRSHLHLAKITLTDFWLTFLAGFLGFTVYSVALNYGEITVSAGIASFIISQIPVVLTILAVIFLGERLFALGWIGSIISFIGILLIAFGQNHSGKLDIGIIYVLIATAAGSLYSLLQKILLKRLHPIEFTAYSIWLGTAAMLVFLPQLIHELPKAPLVATTAAIYIGIFPAAIAYLLWSYVLAQIPTAKAASYLYLVPVITIVMGWLLLGEIPAWLSVIGGLVAIIGAIFVHRGVAHQ